MWEIISPIILNAVNNATQEALNGAEIIHELESLAYVLVTIGGVMGILGRVMKKTIRM